MGAGGELSCDCTVESDATINAAFRSIRNILFNMLPYLFRENKKPNNLTRYRLVIGCEIGRSLYFSRCIEYGEIRLFPL